jgi:hypothetical protein
MGSIPQKYAPRETPRNGRFPFPCLRPLRPHRYPACIDDRELSDDGYRYEQLWLSQREKVKCPSKLMASAPLQMMSRPTSI